MPKTGIEILTCNILTKQLEYIPYEYPKIKPHPKQTQTLENSTISKKEKNKAKRQYYKQVWKITLSNNLSKLMGKFQRGPKQYHIDHVIPISYGFKNNIPPEIIGHISNLRPFHWKQNFLKSAKLTQDAKERLSRLTSVQLTINL